MECPPAHLVTWYTNKNEAIMEGKVIAYTNNPGCDPAAIEYQLWSNAATADCCPDYNSDGTNDCGPFNGTIYKKSDYPASPNAIDTNGEFVYVPDPHWVSQYDSDGNPLLPTNNGPDSFTFKATDCCGESVCCSGIIHVVTDICDEDDYVICDATIAYLSSQFVKGPLNPDQVPFSLNRRGGQTLRQSKRAYIVTKGMNPLLDPDWS